MFAPPTTGEEAMCEFLAENSQLPFCLRTSYNLLTVWLRQSADDQPMMRVNAVGCGNSSSARHSLTNL